MTKQITLEQALNLVEFQYVQYLTRPPEWRVSSVLGDVCGDVHGTVWGEINGRKWYSAETPKEKLPAADWQLVQLFERLVEEGSTKGELLAAINQLENDS